MFSEPHTHTNILFVLRICGLMWFTCSVEPIIIIVFLHFRGRVGHPLLHLLTLHSASPSEDRQKKKKKKLQKEKRTTESKTSLQRSKTFVNLLFKRERSRSKSPSHCAVGSEGHAHVLHPTKPIALILFDVCPRLSQWNVISVEAAFAKSNDTYCN